MRALSTLLAILFVSASATAGPRDPQGSVFVGVTGGGSFSSELSYGSAGLQLGYAVLDGVVPGARGLVLFGDISGGELAGTVWLTPPLELPVVPFVVGEVGYAWQSFGGSDLQGPLYGVGGGVHLGEPDSKLNLRAGAVYRYYDLGSGSGYISPLLVVSFRF